MSEQVREMFSGISGKYDLLNDILSFGIHHKWRRKTVKEAEVKKKYKILDTASGTGDLAFEFYNSLGGDCEITATDFCEDMLILAKKKANQSNYKINFDISDVMNLQFQDKIFDVTSISFGIRNVDDPQKGVAELARVTKSGGRVVILEFGQASGLFGLLYNLYSKYYMPLVGKLIAGHDYAYSYLPKTAKNFPSRENFVKIMMNTGKFSNVKYKSLSGGIAYIYTGIVN